MAFCPAAQLVSCSSFLPTYKVPGLSSAGQSIQRKVSLAVRSEHETNNSKQTPSSNAGKEVPLRRRQLVTSGASAVGLAAAVAGGFLSEGLTTRAAEAATCELVATQSGISYCDLRVGTGLQAEKGMLIKAHYTGTLTDGKVFDSSYNRGKPLVFRVIQGWDLGILGAGDLPPMLAGGKRTLRLPANLAYGSRGAGCRGSSCAIPPNSTLLFDVEFVGKV
eukprot:jgi/Mesen1/7980/ME000425S07176